MERILLIGLGGGIGSILRYLVSTGAYKLFSRDFPYGTLCVNAIGSFLAGFLFIILVERFNGNSDQFRALLIIGFLGGFTTFSAFSYETMSLLESGDLLRAGLNVVVSIVLCLSLTWFGILLGRQL